MACAQIRPRPTWPGTFRWRVASKDVELRPGNPRCRCDPMALARSASWQNPEELDDAQIAALAQAGSESAFREIIRRNNRRLYRIARAVVSDAGEAEDVLQEAYLKAFAGLADFRGEAALSTWLTRITLNEAPQRRRRIARWSSFANWTARHLQARTSWSSPWALRSTTLKRQPRAPRFVACSNGR